MLKLLKTTYSSTSITDAHFIELPGLHNADLITIYKNKNLITFGFFPKNKSRTFPNEGVAEWLLTTSSMSQSLPSNAIYSLVKMDQAITYDNIMNYKVNDIEKCIENYNSNEYRILYKSYWDNEIWDLDGSKVFLPTQFQIRSSEFDLDAVFKYKENIPGIVSFEKIKNIKQNYDISGEFIGLLTINPNLVSNYPKLLNRDTIQFEYFRLKNNSDLFNIEQFRFAAKTK